MARARTSPRSLFDPGESRSKPLESPSIPEEFRERLLSRLGSRLNAAGELVVHAREERSQYLNRRAALAKLDTLIGEALVVRRMRRATKPTKASVRRRLESKTRRSELKNSRRLPPESGD